MPLHAWPLRFTTRMDFPPRDKSGYRNMNSATKAETLANREAVYRIGELSKEFDVTLRTLRFYEDKGLLSPRRIGNTRLYSRADRTRLKLILLGKRVGMSLLDVKEILDLYDPKGGLIAQFEFGAAAKGRTALAIFEEWDLVDRSARVSMAAPR